MQSQLKTSYNDAVQIDKLKQKNETMSNQYKWKNSTTMFGTRGATSCSTFQLPSCRQDKLLQLSQVLSLRQVLFRGRGDNIT